MMELKVWRVACHATVAEGAVARYRLASGFARRSGVLKAVYTASKRLSRQNADDSRVSVTLGLNRNRIDGVASTRLIPPRSAEGPDHTGTAENNGSNEPKVR